MRVPKNRIVPRGMITTLTYCTTLNVANVGVGNCSIRFNPCYLYDVDPTLGSTAMPGYAEFATLYASYRTISSTIEVDFNNRESFQATAWICPSDADVGANYANFNYFNANALCKTFPLGPTTGAGTCRMIHTLSSKDMGFPAAIDAGDALRGYGSTAPTNPWFWNVGLVTSLAQVSGMFVTVRVHITAHFGDIKQPGS